MSDNDYKDLQKFLLNHPECAGVYVNNDTGYCMPSIYANRFDWRLQYVRRVTILEQF